MGAGSWGEYGEETGKGDYTAPLQFKAKVIKLDDAT